MRTDTPQPIRLSDYTPPGHLIDTVALDIALDPHDTLVRARLAVRPNPEAAPGPLVLAGEQLRLESLKINGVALAAQDYTLDNGRLTVSNVPASAFTVEIETRIAPTANKALTGLFLSRGIYCTQCEAEGFRRITFHPDRPDVLSIYTTRIEADVAAAPVLLSNGNLVDSGQSGGRHFAVWHDPFPKPSYLFAMVGGDLGVVEDTFKTMSGRQVALKIYVERGKEARAGYAMEALKRSMRFDEEAFGREYDLEIFMIVAVSDFNMGAMENKGLNVFNDKFVLASPQTATDVDYANIEAVIAHEYFHNWTGNRITCRDWFQLCLKEGLTVFRDQEFTSTVRSRPVKRIADIRQLRHAQFPEDGGPLAHPVRPASYIEINNFYTATVYEKGAEVIRVLKTLIGPDAFRRGMDLYFERHDGEATTVEAFVACMAQAAGRDLEPFMTWYTQAGTPRLKASGSHDRAARTFTLRLEQSCDPTPGQPEKHPVVMPVALGLVLPDGTDAPLATAADGPLGRPIVELTGRSLTATFTGITERPVLSLNRAFSVPVNLVLEQSEADLVFLMGHDSDPFNRWQAAQNAAMALILGAIRAGNGARPQAGPFVEALGRTLGDETLEPAFRAEIARMPSEPDIAREIASDVDTDAVHAAHAWLRGAVGSGLTGLLDTLTARHLPRGPYSPDAADAGRRALANTALDLACCGTDGAERARAHYTAARNMTDRMAALGVLKNIDAPERRQALEDFYAAFEGDNLVIDKWFALQAASTLPDTLEAVKALTRHPAFTMDNPNRLRSLVGTFAMANQVRFNAADGAGYAFLADIVLQLDASNPQVAARMLGALKSWRILDAGRRAAAARALTRIAETPSISKDVYEIATKSLQ